MFCEKLTYMSRTQRAGEKTEQFSLRIPKDVMDKIDELKLEEGTDRSVIIMRAIKYWLSVDGKITTDNEYLTRLKEISEELKSYRILCSDFQKERQNYQETILKQQTTIDTLLTMIAANK